MYPKKNSCLEKETTSSYSKAVIGILVITMMIAVGLSILGVWGSYDAKNGVQSDVRETPFVPDNKPLEDKISEDQSSGIKSSKGDLLKKASSDNSIEDIKILEDTYSEIATSGTGDVSVAECSEKFGPFDTEPGTIEIVHATLPPEDWEVPLCLTTDDVDDYGMIVAVKGGYSPVGTSSILVCQDKYGYQGKIIVTWTEISEDDLPADHPICDDYAACCWDFYQATLSIDGSICLESNQAPILGSDFNVYPCDIDLQKSVWFKYKGIWTGCELPDQQFLIILAHKSLSQNPQLSMRDTSPVCK
ncbi:MAG: hypothetical protein ACFFAH_08580 [Promethearchaeota archaeon]